MDRPMLHQPDEGSVGAPAGAARARVLSIAELAECTCPELCLRDHDNE